jgi:hypothetical protein
MFLITDIRAVTERAKNTNIMPMNSRRRFPDRLLLFVCSPDKQRFAVLYL